MAEFGEMYKNPLVNIAFTAIEPLPVGLVFTLVTAGVFGRKRRTTSTGGVLQSSHVHTIGAMNLGAFSVSLAVKDIEASKQFYEKLGFTTFGGDQAHNWLIMKNGDHVIGLFQGMFEKNILTFNPGWDSNAQPLPSSPTCASCSGS